LIELRGRTAGAIFGWLGEARRRTERGVNEWKSEYWGSKGKRSVGGGNRSRKRPDVGNAYERRVKEFPKGRT